MEMDGVAAGDALGLGPTGDPIGGRDLRWVLTGYLRQAGELSVREMVEALEVDGYDVLRRPSKVVSDALRWEIRWGRVVRLRRGVYAFGRIPRATAYRMRKGLERMRAWQAARRVRIVEEQRDREAGLPPPARPYPEERYHGDRGVMVRFVDAWLAAFATPETLATIAAWPPRTRMKPEERRRRLRAQRQARLGSRAPSPA